MAAKRTQVIPEDLYYEWMGSFEDVIHDKKEVTRRWKACFMWAITHRYSGFTQKAMLELFNGFQMDNWPALQLENTEYAGKSRDEILESFVGDASYISDRVSFDRIFRVHYLYVMAYHNDFMWEKKAEEEQDAVCVD